MLSSSTASNHLRAARCGLRENLSSCSHWVEIAEKQTQDLILWLVEWQVTSWPPSLIGRLLVKMRALVRKEWDPVTWDEPLNSGESSLQVEEWCIRTSGAGRGYPRPRTEHLAVRLDGHERMVSFSPLPCHLPTVHPVQESRRHYLPMSSCLQTHGRHSRSQWDRKGKESRTEPGWGISDGH